MIVECCSNKLADITNEKHREQLMMNIHQSEVALDVGRQYVVYGIIFWEGMPWYYVCEEESDSYPHPYFAAFFRVVDPTLSSSWELYWPADEGNEASLVPREWGQSREVYERLVDGNQLEQEVFIRLKILMDTEAKH
jgi:hypothetical protein